MSEKYELASYLSSLLAIMESREDAGIHRGQTLGEEYTRGYTRLIESIKEDESNETRKRAQHESPKGSLRDGQSLDRGSISDGDT